MKLYERIENNNFDEIDRNRAIELIEGENGHLVYNENYFKLQKENQTLKSFVSGIFNENIEKDFIPVQKVKDKIKHYQELQDNYIKKYDETNEGLQAMINVLQELIEEREEK